MKNKLVRNPVDDNKYLCLARPFHVEIEIFTHYCVHEHHGELFSKQSPRRHLRIHDKLSKYKKRSNQENQRKEMLIFL